MNLCSIAPGKKKTGSTPGTYEKHSQDRLATTKLWGIFSRGESEGHEAMVMYEWVVASIGSELHKPATGFLQSQKLRKDHYVVDTAWTLADQHATSGHIMRMLYQPESHALSEFQNIRQFIIWTTQQSHRASTACTKHIVWTSLNVTFQSAMASGSKWTEQAFFSCKNYHCSSMCILDFGCVTSPKQSDDACHHFAMNSRICQSFESKR